MSPGAYFRTKDGKLIRLETKPGAVQAALSSASVKQIVPSVTITARKKGEDGVKDPVKAILVPKGTGTSSHKTVDLLFASYQRFVLLVSYFLQSTAQYHRSRDLQKIGGFRKLAVKGYNQEKSYLGEKKSFFGNWL